MTKALSILEIKNKEQIELDFVINCLKSRTIGFISGAGGTGKSLFALNIAFSLADYTKKFNFEPLIFPNTARGKVFYLSLEDDIKVLEYRIQRLSASIEEFFGESCIEAIDENLFVYPLYGQNFTLHRRGELDQKVYDTLLQIGENARLIVIDTFRRLHSESENDNGIMSDILKLLEGICQKTGTTILLVHHQNKNSIFEKNSDQTALRGASALVDNARFILNLTAITDSEMKKIGLMNKDEKKQYAKVSFAKVNYAIPPDDFFIKKGNFIYTFNINEENNNLNLNLTENKENDNQKKTNLTAYDLI